MATDVGSEADGRVPVIILVHGTFSGPTTPFFVSLRESLAGTLPSTMIEAFEWDGGNSVESRLRAERRLTFRLRQFQDRPVLVIGHSHGGNVAYRAISRTCLWGPRSIRGLATIGTPFISLSVRGDVEEQIRPLLNVLTFITTVPIFVVATAAFFIVADWLVDLLKATGIPHAPQYYAFMLIMFGLMWSAIPVFRRIEVGPRISSGLERLLNTWKRKCVRGVPSWGQDRQTDIPTLCVIGADDEAYGWLRFLRLLCHLPYRALKLVNFMFKCSIAFALIGLAAGAAINVSESIGTPLTRGGYARPGSADDFQLLCIIFALSASCVLLIAALTAFVIGPLLLQSVVGLGARRFGFYLWLKASVYQFPPQATQVTVRTVDEPKAAWLLHTSYFDDARLVCDVRDWCVQKLERSSSAVPQRFESQ